jgi:hypothetical protein
VLATTCVDPCKIRYRVRPSPPPANLAAERERDFVNCTTSKREHVGTALQRSIAAGILYAY